MVGLREINPFKKLKEVAGKATSFIFLKYLVKLKQASGFSKKFTPGSIAASGCKSSAGLTGNRPGLYSNVAYRTFKNTVTKIITKTTMPMAVSSL